MTWRIDCFIRIKLLGSDAPNLAISICMQRRLFLGNILKPIGLITTACVGATPPAPGSAAAPAQPDAPKTEALTKIKSGGFNALAVAQASFHRMFKDGSLTLDTFPHWVKMQCGLTRVQWSGGLLPAITQASAKTLRSACDAQGVRSLLIDPSIGIGLASADATVSGAAVEKLKPWCDIAIELACTGLAIDLRGEGTYQEQLPRAVAGANLAFKVAAAVGLPLVAQSLGGFTSNATFMAALMEQLKNPGIRLEPTFDSWKVSEQETYNRARGMGLMLPYAASILADYTDFATDGDSVNFKSDYLMRQIRATTFRGPVTILYKGPGDELAGVLKAKSILIKYKCVV